MSAHCKYLAAASQAIAPRNTTPILKTENSLTLT